MNDFIEQRIILAVRGLLTGRVNELLRGIDFSVPIIEFGEHSCGYAVAPVITLNTCERTEKERIIRQDAYSLTITFSLPETPESELHCYAYAGAVSKAVYEDPCLSGVVDKAIVTGKVYKFPKKKNCGEAWDVVISLRLTIERITE